MDDLEMHIELDHNPTPSTLLYVYCIDGEYFKRCIETFVTSKT